MIAALCIAATAAGTCLVLKGPVFGLEAPDANALFALAVKDAFFAEADEIMPLVEITKDSDKVTWNDAGDKVLLLSWHRYPDNYPSGQEVTFEWGEVWTFTDREIVERNKQEKDHVTDWTAL